MRLRFDSDVDTVFQCPSLPAMLSLSRNLVCAYKLGKGVHDEADDERFISISLLMIQLGEKICEEVSKADERDVFSSYLWTSVRMVLEICCSFIGHNASRRDVPLDVPLMVLTEFTSLGIYPAPEGHSSQETNNPAVKLIGELKKHLCNNGYFCAIKLLLDNKVSMATIRGTQQEQHRDESLTRTILELIGKFFASEDEETRYVAYRKAAKELFAQQLTDQMKCFLLPSLSNLRFPYAEMVESLSCRQLLRDLTPVRTLNLLYCILVLGKPHFACMGAEQLCSFTEVVANLIRHVEKDDAKHPPEDPVKDRMDDDDDDDDEEEEEEDDEEDKADDMDYEEHEGMEWSNESESRTANEKTEKQLKKLCFHLLGNDGDLSNRLGELLRSESVGCLASDERAISSLCKICYSLIGLKKQAASRQYRMIRVLGCSPTFIRKVWDIISTPSSIGCDSYLVRVSRATKGDMLSEIPLLSTFCNAYSYQLIITSDADIAKEEANSQVKTFGDLRTLSDVALTLRNCCLGLVLLAHNRHKLVGGRNASSVDREMNDDYHRVFKEAVALTRQLYERNCRINFCSSEDWVAPGWSLDLLGPNCRNFLDRKMWNSMEFDRVHLSSGEVSKLVILKELPFTINFSERVEFFRNLLSKDKPEMRSGPWNSGETIKIRRKYIYEDAFRNLNEQMVPDMKVKLHFSLISTLGLEEIGIDGGGIFRETLREIIKAGFNPELGFFQATPEGMLHPNHLAEKVNKEYLRHFFFLGRILGKAIYARLLVDLPLASFFLVKLLSQETTRLDIHHLTSLDPKIYKNLLSLRDPQVDVKNLLLYFAVDCDVLGAIETVDLKPNGSNIQVDNQNKFEYIHLLADWYLNKRIKRHCVAFRSGLASVVDIDWLRMFDHNELQFLISGADVPIDLEDLKRNTNYTGGYTVDHEVIQNFWSIVEEFTETQRQDLLKFVTCSPRAPLYGFKELRPSFCIHLAGTETDRLPTSSTCMNLLKLPAFQDRATLKEKLLKAVELGAGFELS